MVHQYLVRHEAGQNGCLGVVGLYYRLEQTVHSDYLIGLDFGDVIHQGAVQAVVRGQEAKRDIEVYSVIQFDGWNVIDLYIVYLYISSSMYRQKIL